MATLGNISNMQLEQSVAVGGYTFTNFNFSPHNFFLGNNGTKLVFQHFIQSTSRYVLPFTLSNGYDITSIQSTTDASLLAFGGNIFQTVSSNGEYIYTVGSGNPGGSILSNWQLPVAWDFSSKTGIGNKTFSDWPVHYKFNTTGNKLYTMLSTGVIKEYSLSTPHMQSTATATGKTLDVKTITGDTQGFISFCISNDGTRLYAQSNARPYYYKNFIHQFTMSTPWDLNTAVHDDTLMIYEAGAYDSQIKGIATTDDGGQLFIMWDVGKVLERYTLYSTTYKYLLKNEIDGNIYTINTGSIVLLGNGAITENMFLNDGKDDTTEFDQTVFDQIADDDISIHEYIDDQSVVSRDITINYIPNSQLILPTDDINITSVENIDSITLTANQSGGGEVGLLASIDSGATWQAFDGVNWLNVDPGDMLDVETKAMPVSTVNTLTSEQIMSLVGTSNTLRFAYYLEVTSASDVAETDEIAMQIDMKGKWAKAEHNVDYSYNYPNSLTLHYELYTNGDFKINY